MPTSAFWRAAMHELNVVIALAGRDLLKFFRDPGRMIAAGIFPFVTIFLLGGTLQLNLGKAAGFNFIGFTFTGFLGMTLFQSTAQGLTSLMDDRQNDFRTGDVRFSRLAILDRVREDPGRDARRRHAGGANGCVRRHPPGPADRHGPGPVGAGGAAVLLHGRIVWPFAAEHDDRLASFQPDLQLRLPAAVLPGGVDKPDQQPPVVPRSPLPRLADAVRDRPRAGGCLRGLARL